MIRVSNYYQECTIRILSKVCSFFLLYSENKFFNLIISLWFLRHALVHYSYIRINLPWYHILLSEDIYHLYHIVIWYTILISRINNCLADIYSTFFDLLLYKAYCRHGEAMPKKGNVTKILCPEFECKKFLPFRGQERFCNELESGKEDNIKFLPY